MTKKVFALVSGLIGAVATAGEVVVTFIEPTNMSAIIGSIGIVSTALISVISLFKKEESTQN